MSHVWPMTKETNARRDRRPTPAACSREEVFSPAVPRTHTDLSRPPKYVVFLNCPVLSSHAVHCERVVGTVSGLGGLDAARDPNARRLCRPIDQSRGELTV